MRIRYRLFLIAAAGVVGCSGRNVDDATATRTTALTSTLAAIADTFINSAFPDNNNGASPSIFTGHNGQGGMMRGLVRFVLPQNVQGRVNVSRVRLTLLTRGTGLNEDVPPTPATVSLEAVLTPWTEGVGVGNAMTMFTIGQPCNSNGTATGATWNQANCAGGTPWVGGAVVTGASGAASVPAALEAAVTWDSASNNDRMMTDVQSWLDDPDGNFGWRLASSTETDNFGAAQKFYSSEDPGAKGPLLVVDYTCKAAFATAGNLCTTCTPGAIASCGGGAATPGNICVDPGAPATGYNCVCTVPGYVSNGIACERVVTPDASDAGVTDGGDGAAGSGGGGGGGAGGTTGAGGTGGGGGTTGGGGAGGATGAGGTGGGAGTSGAAGTSGGAGTTGTAGTTGVAGTTGSAGTTGTAGTAGGAGGTTGAGGTGGAAGAAGGGTGGGTGGATAGTSGGRGGTTGSGGSAAGRGGSSGATGTAGTHGKSGDSGCSCAVGVRAGRPDYLAALLAVVGIVVRRRRR
jgi:hypothetical protein